MGKIRHLGCCVCGKDAGTFEQHWNRDTGFGVCASCVAWVRSRGETEEEIRDLYGVEGVNFAAPTKTFKNRNFTKRDYECTNVVACEGAAAPDDNFVPCDPAELKGLTALWTERGVRYFGYL